MPSCTHMTAQLLAGSATHLSLGAEATQEHLLVPNTGKTGHLKVQAGVPTEFCHDGAALEHRQCVF